MVVQIQTPRRFSCRGTILLKELNIPSAQSKTEREKFSQGKSRWGDYKLIEKRSFKVTGIKCSFLEAFIIAILVLGIDILGPVLYLPVYISYMFY